MVVKIPDKKMAANLFEKLPLIIFIYYNLMPHNYAIILRFLNSALDSLLLKKLGLTYNT